jgi:hypothetical protein
MVTGKGAIKALRSGAGKNKLDYFMTMIIITLGTTNKH